MKIVKLFGERVLVKKTKISQGTIYVPESAQENELHRVGEVVSVGSGERPGQEKKKMLVTVGQLVYFQVNAIIATHYAYDMDGDLWLNLHQRDLIGTVSDPNVTLEKFQPLGNWCVVEPYVVKAGNILLPDSILRDPSILHWRLIKRGSECALPVEIGQEITLNMGRCNTFMLDRKEYGYIVENEITGAVQNIASATVSVTTEVEAVKTE